MKNTSQRILLFCFVFAIVHCSTAIAGMIDLNDFYADPSVTIAADGSSAVMEEDISLMTIFLSNDPFLGDPMLPFPSDPFQLSFSYEFIVGASNWDGFYVKLFDADTGIILEDLLVESDRTDSTPWINSDTVTWNIGGAPTAGLGLEFQLNALDLEADSSVLISNVLFETSQIPEPATIFLFGLGLFGIAGVGRKKQSFKN